MDLFAEKTTLFSALTISASTMNRKVSRDEALASNEGKRIVGVAKLVG